MTEDNTLWLNISKSGKGVYIKLDNKFYSGSVANLKEFLEKLEKNDKGYFKGFALNVMSKE
ncbi:MAG: hypothetical protein ACE5ES_01795 [Candidatus Nanoarchaeia archaeon]